jgi:hypothetical protein
MYEDLTKQDGFLDELQQFEIFNFLVNDDHEEEGTNHHFMIHLLSSRHSHFFMTKITSYIRAYDSSRSRSACAPL